MDIFGYLESCRHRYGLDAANIWNGMLTSMDEDYLKKVREALDERDLTLCVLTTDSTHVWDPDPALRAKNKANTLAHLNAARILGAEFMRDRRRRFECGRPHVAGVESLVERSLRRHRRRLP